LFAVALLRVPHQFRCQYL